MKIVIARISAEIGIADALYSELNQPEWRLNPEQSSAAVTLSAKFSEILGCKVVIEQIYDNWEEAGH